MRVPSALFALVPLLGQLTQAHHDATPSNHQPRSFQIDVMASQPNDILHPDGTMNLELVKRAVKHRHDRHEAQAVAATAGGKAHSNFMEQAQEMENMYRAKKARAVGKASKAGRLSLTAIEHSSWVGELGLGLDRSQNISALVLDTDGPKLDIYAKGSPTKCSTLYDPTKSPQAIKGPSYTSGDGKSSGDYYHDSVIFGGLKVANQAFVAFTNTSDGLHLEQNMLLPPGACGVLGLGFNSQHPTLVQTLISHNAIAQPLFAVRLTKRGGSVDIGAVNPHYKHDIVWAPLKEGVKSTSWTITTTAFTKNGQPVASGEGIDLQFQTYYPYMVTPEWLGKALLADMDVSIDEDTHSLFQVACHKIKHHRIGFVIGGQTMEMTVSSLNLGHPKKTTPLTKNSARCNLAILRGENPVPLVTFGTVAMRSFYVAHSFANKNMGPALGIAHA